jgi:hypothetical protein
MVKYCFGCRKYCYFDVFFKAYICNCTVEKRDNEEIEEEDIEEEIEDIIEEETATEDATECSDNLENES